MGVPIKEPCPEDTGSSRPKKQDMGHHREAPKRLFPIIEKKRSPASDPVFSRFNYHNQFPEIKAILGFPC